MPPMSIARPVHSNDLATALISPKSTCCFGKCITITFGGRTKLITQLTRVSLTKIRTATSITPRGIYLICTARAMPSNGVVHNSGLRTPRVGHPCSVAYIRTPLTVGPPTLRLTCVWRWPFDGKTKTRP